MTKTERRNRLLQAGTDARPSPSVGKSRTMTSPPAGGAPLRRWEKAGLALFGLLVLGFGAITEIRSAFQNTQSAVLAQPSGSHGRT